MNLQQISQLLNIDFSEMKLQSGFKKLSKNQKTSSKTLTLRYTLEEHAKLNKMRVVYVK